MPTIDLIDRLITTAWQRLKQSRRDGTPHLIELHQNTLDALLDQRLRQMDQP